MRKAEAAGRKIPPGCKRSQRGGYNTINFMSTEKTINFPQQEISASRQDITCLQAIFKAIPDGVVFADLERRIVMVNPALENIFGYREEELLGKTTDILYASREEYEEQGRIRFNLSSQEKLVPYVVEYRKKDGTVFPSETVGTPLLDEGGEIFGFVGLIRDITTRKKA
jgi:PAS domain S-box-containing protein